MENRPIWIILKTRRRKNFRCHTRVQVTKILQIATFLSYHHFHCWPVFSNISLFYNLKSLTGSWTGARLPGQLEHLRQFWVDSIPNRFHFKNDCLRLSVDMSGVSLYGKNRLGFQSDDFHSSNFAIAECSLYTWTGDFHDKCTCMYCRYWQIFLQW